jgi:AraC family transcriptional regulator
MPIAAALEPGEIVRRVSTDAVEVHHVRVAGDDHQSHIHPEVVQIFVLHAGAKVRALWSGAAGSPRRFDSEAGQISIVAPGQAHLFDWRFAEATSLFVAPAAISELVESELTQCVDFADIPHVDDAFVSHKAWQLAKLTCSDHPDEIALNATAFELIVRLYERIAGRSVKTIRPERDRFIRLAAFIEESLPETLTIAGLRQVAGVPRYALQGLVRAHSGMTLHQYVRSRRIARAKRALSNSLAPISEIAIECGFSHQSHLTQTFHMMEGVTPAQFRALFASS